MKLHMIGNAHLDPVWFWRWPEGYQEVKATFRSALDRMNETPDFTFTCSAAAYYEWLEEDEPEMFAEIKRRVEEGRWSIVGGWWIQPDCNAPCGESFVRQGLIAQRYFRSRFGHAARTAYNVDSFGHNGMLPQIFRLSGMDRYVFMRPMKHEKMIPSNIFVWQSADGSRVDAFRIPIAYCTWEPDLRVRMEGCVAEMPEDAPETMVFYGVGNHGGGPTKVNIAAIESMKAEMNAEFSDPDRFFDGLDDSRLPVVRGELLHHASGCYSAHSGVKRWNRRAENALLAAEKWCAIAADALGRAYPAQKLTHAWKDVLFNQFHDILAGTSAQEAYGDARNQLGEAAAIAQRAANSAMQALSWRIEIPADEQSQPIVVFNPNAFDACLPIEVQCVSRPGWALYDDEGRLVPSQLAQSSVAANGRAALLFQADVPAMGYRLFSLRPGAAPDSKTMCDAFALDNGRVRAVISPETGLLLSLTDVQSGEALTGPSCRGVVIRDESDTWSHGVTVFADVIGEFALKRAERIKDGPVRSAIRCVFEWGKSTIVQTYALWRDSDALDVTVDVNWQEQEKMLKWELCAAGETSMAEIPFGFAERPADGLEYPMQTWVRQGALTCVNDSKFAYDARDQRLRVTLLRSPRYAHHEPKVCKSEEHFPFMDQGWQRVRFELTPRALEPSEATKRGMVLNQPAFVVQETFHEGSLGGHGSFCRVDGALLTALKQAEDGSGDWIAHLYEADGKNADVQLALPNGTFALALKPHEIAAVRVSKDGVLRRVNFLEDDL